MDKSQGNHVTIATVVPTFTFKHCTNELDDCGEHASHLTVLGFRTQGVTSEVTAAAFLAAWRLFCVKPVMHPWY